MSRLPKTAYVAGLLLLLVAGLPSVGCSHIENVKVISHFAQPVQILIDGEKTTPIVPANGEATLKERFYLGGTHSLEVTVLSVKGAVLKPKEWLRASYENLEQIATFDVEPERLKNHKPRSW